MSSCLLEIPTQWNEDYKRIEELIDLAKSGGVIFMCPEQLGGLPTPREPAEIEQGKTAKDVLKGDGKVLTKTGKDVTKQFVAGANRVLRFCQEMEIKTAILKARSPSCGSAETYDGTFSKTLKSGKGITAELLTQNRVEVYNEENFPSSI